MTKGDETRQKMLETTAELLQSQGYHATGLRQILELSGTPRGSLYFHFPEGKERLAAEAASAAAAEWQALLSAQVASAASGTEALAAVIDLLGARLAESDWKLGNPVATLALEMSPYSEIIRQTCAHSYTEWQAVIREMLERFEIGPPELRENLALFLLASIEGALVLARTQQSLKPLEVVKATLRGAASLL